MARTVIGIDVGTNAVRAAEVELRARPRLKRFGQVALPAGAVKEGEVVDIDAVAEALRRLWREAGFRGRGVRVGIASARVILRVLPVPAMSERETRSALQLSLADHVPLPPDETVFDVQRLPGAPTGDGEAGPVLLAAAHRAAVDPLVAAVRAAKLKVQAIEPLPAALVRAQSLPTYAKDGGRRPVEAIVSVGAGMILVVVARAGVPLFARTITSLSSGLVTERISSELAVPADEAERLKRGLSMLPASSQVDQARRTARSALGELLEEISDSLGYYGAQPGAQAIERIVLTGGGALLAGLPDRLSERLDLPVVAADPLAAVTVGNIGFGPGELGRLAPYLLAPLGVALGGARTRAARLDLRPAAPARQRPRGVVLAAGAGVVLIGLGGLTYVRRAGELDEQRSLLNTARAELAAASATTVPAADQSTPGDRSSAVADVVAVATAVDLDWPAITGELKALSVPLGVSFGSVSGTSTAPAAATVTATTTATTAAPATSSPPSEATEASAGDSTTATTAAPTLVGQLTLAGSAPDRPAVSAWIEAMEASPRFEGVFVASVSTIQTEGATTVEFSAQLSLTSTSRVARDLALEATS